MPEQVYQNTLFIGLGGTGGRVLKELRKQIYEMFGEIPAGLGFMYVDSSLELMQQNDPTWLTSDGYNAQFTYRDFLNISLPGDGNTFIGTLKYYPNLKELAENCEGLRNYHPNYGAMQNRRIGRILIGASATSFERMLLDHYHQLQDETNCCHVNIAIVTGLSGGTGSGAVVSVIAHILRMYPEKVSLYATLPVVPFPYDHGRSLANTYAALRELNALNIGRLKVTDLVTGEKFQPEMPYDNSLNYCHYLQENKLFRLFLFDKFLNEYDKISNILYHNLWLNENDAAVESYRKYLDMYNRITEPEFDASTLEEKELVYARTKAVGLLSLYCLVYPRQQILRYIAYGVAEQSYNQLLFNRYIEDLGYVDEPLPTMPIDMRDLDRWDMDEAHLTLDKTSDYMHQHVRRFRDEWENVSIFITDEFRAAGGRSQMRDMAERFRDYYDSHFRGYGVDIYFHNATAGIHHHADRCFEQYELHMVTSLMAGERGVYHVIEETKELIKHLQSLQQEAEKKEAYCSESIQHCQNGVEEITHDFESSSILIMAIRRDRYIQRITHTLTYLYEEKTIHRSLAYASQLLAELVAKAQELVANLEELKHVLTDKRKEASRLALEETEVPSHTLYVVNQERVRQFMAKLYCCRPVMERLAALTRDSIFGKELQPIRRLVEDMRHERNTRPRIRHYYETIREFDSEQHAHEQLFSAGILEEMLRSSIDRNSLDEMLRTAINAAAVRTLLNNNELLMAIHNNPLPTDTFMSLGRTMAPVRIPQPMNGHEEELSEQLTAEVRALGNHEWQMEINSHSDNRDEISIATVCANFPLRCLRSLPDIKLQYDELIANNGQQAVRTLYTEDSFANLPSLEVEAYVEPPVNDTEETGDTDIFGIPLIEKESLAPEVQPLSNKQLLQELSRSYATHILNALKDRQSEDYVGPDIDLLLCDTHLTQRHLSLELYLEGAECSMTGIISSTPFDPSKATENYLVEFEKKMEKMYEEDIFGCGVESLYNREKEKIGNFIESNLEILNSNIISSWEGFEHIGLTQARTCYQCVINYLRKLEKEAKKQKVQSRHIVLTIEQALSKNRNDYKRIAPSLRAVKAKLVYDEHRKLLTTLYEAKQKIVAEDYETYLISELCEKINQVSAKLAPIIERIDQMTAYIRNCKTTLELGKDFKDKEKMLIPNDDYLEWVLDDFHEKIRFGSFELFNKWLNKKSIDKWIEDYIMPELNKSLHINITVL